MNALLFAILAPLVWALMSVLDKYVVTRKAIRPLSYCVVAALAQLILASIVALFLDWNGLDSVGVLFAALAGVFLGFQFFSYFVLLRTEDASDVTGLAYVYPIVVAILAFFILGEILPLLAYGALVIIILAAILLSSRWPELRGRRLYLFILFVIAIALTEFMTKLASAHIDEWHGLVISSAALAITVSVPLLSVPSVRRKLPSELANIRYAIPVEALTLAAVFFTYLAMAELSVTIVSAIGAAQPLGVLLLEGIILQNGLRLTRHSLRQKIIPILLIVAGVALLYIMQG